MIMDDKGFPARKMGEPQKRWRVSVNGTIPSFDSWMMTTRLPNHDESDPRLGAVDMLKFGGAGAYHLLKFHRSINVCLFAFVCLCALSFFYVLLTSNTCVILGNKGDC